MKKVKASRKWKLLKESFKKNICFDSSILVVILISLYTATYSLDFISYLGQAFDYAKGVIEDIKLNEETDIEEIKKELDGYILYADTQINLDLEYKIKNEVLYTIQNEKVDLSGVKNSIILGKSGVTNKTLKEMNLKDSEIEYIMFDLISITDGFINELPRSLKSFSLSRCDYITDLSDLDKACPNIEELRIERITSLKSYDFIYNMSNLKVLSITDSYGITEELLDYCKSAGITVISNGNEVENTQKIKNIASEIINEEMDDEEKIRAVVTYVIDNLTYKNELTNDSNINPLDNALNNEGVCISYAYLTSVLLNEAGINSYRVNADGHIWNLVEVYGEYYYIDTTNIDSAKNHRNFFKILGKSPYYMSDPNNNLFLSSKDIDDICTNIPTELKLAVLAGEDEKTLIEKYGSSVGVVTIILLEIAKSLMFAFGVIYTKEALEELFGVIYTIDVTYKELKEKELMKK